jgi:hypothetical protein
MRQEVVADEKAHEDYVVNDAFEVEAAHAAVIRGAHFISKVVTQDGNF